MRVVMIGVAVLAAGIARAANDQRSTGPALDLPLEGYTTAPAWRMHPSGAQIGIVYPKFASMLAIGGRAELQCAAETDGSVDECHVVTETPQGLGFGAAALKLAPYFQMTPATEEGRAVKGSVTVPIRFSLARTLSPAPSPPPAAVDAARLELAREILDLQGSAITARQSWRAWLDRLTTQAVTSGDAQPLPEVSAALQQAIDDVVSEVLDRRARDLAMAATLDDLKAIRDFLKTPAGRLWLTATKTPETKAFEESDGQRLVRDARERLCATFACGPAS